MQNTIGISFSTQHCFVTQTICDRESTRLIHAESFLHHNTPLHAIETNANTVRQWLSKSTHVILALSSRDILLHLVDVDKTLSDNELMHYIQSQSQNWFGHASRELCIDYETQWIENNTRRILIAACPQTVINQYQCCFSALSIPLYAIDIDVLALSRLMGDSIPQDNSILLFHQEDQLLLVSTHHRKPQNCQIVPTVSQLKRLPHLSPLNTAFFISMDTSLQTQLHEMGFNFMPLDTTNLFNSQILNQTPLSVSSLYPYLTSLGACFWSKPS